MLQPSSSLSQGSGETGSFKFLGAMFTVWVPMFLICWFGELLTEQVLFIFCVTQYYSYKIKRTINKQTYHQSQSIFGQYLLLSTTCYMFRLFRKAIIRHKHNNISRMRKRKHFVGQKIMSGSILVIDTLVCMWFVYPCITMGCLTLRALQHVLFSTERSSGTSNIWMQMVRRFWALQEIRTFRNHAVSESCTTVRRTLLCHISGRIC